jgi:beta-galactosidase
MTAWTKGIAWVNGHNLGRFWSIGPQQTLYVPGCWLRKGGNEIVVLDFFGPRGKCEVDFVGKAVLDVLQLDTDFNRVRREHEKFAGGEEVAAGTFPSGDASQVVMFGKGVRGNYFTLQAVTTYDAKNLATVSEFAFLDRDGNPMNALDVQITGVDSEEEIREDGVAENAVDGQIEAFWLTSSRTLPHWIEFHVPAKAEVFGFRYTPRQGKDIGRIKDWKFFAR